jgi:hypothetical protein
MNKFQDFPMTITENADGSFVIEWDENHPVTSIFNNWTEKNFLDMLMQACSDTIDQSELDIIEK